MKRSEVYLQVLSEKTGEPPERLLLALDEIKRRMNDDLDDEFDPARAESLILRRRTALDHKKRPREPSTAKGVET